MDFWEGVFGFAKEHPVLTTCVATTTIVGGGCVAYKLADKAVDVIGRTCEKAIDNGYAVNVGKVWVGPCDKQPEEEMIVDEEGCLTVKEE